MPFSTALLWSSLILIPAAVTSARADTSVSQHGFTWRFAEDHETGQYANGDWWVLGPVSIVEINPLSENVSGWIKNGTQVDPIVSTRQGFDNSMDYCTYSSELNLAPSITGEPLNLESGSVVSTLSVATRDNRPQLQRAAILTVVNERPHPDAFRPSYVGSDKTSYWRVSEMDTSFLPSLKPGDTVPSLSWAATFFEKPWLEQNPIWTGRYIHPVDNQKDYGRDMAIKSGYAALALCTDQPYEEKLPLLIGMVQYGIDIYGVAKTGGEWTNNGGHSHGRKLPLLIAAKALNEENMFRYGDASQYMIFGEDQQTFYVTDQDVGRSLYSGDGRQRDPYMEEHVGLPEWGEKHYTDSSRDGSNWGVSYRTTVGSSIAAHVIAARLLGLEDAWNWPPLFDYVDRYVAIESSDANGKTNELSVLDVHMHRATALAPLRPTELSTNEKSSTAPHLD